MSGITDYGSFGPDDPNVQPNNQVTPVSNSGSPASPLSASSIQASELQALALMLLANFPVLVAPDSNGNAAPAVGAAQVAATTMNTASIQHDIISGMWDKYIENIREVAERAKKDDIKHQTELAGQSGPKSSAEYLTFLMSISATQRAEEIAGSAANALTTNFTQTYNTWLVNPIDSGSSTAILGLSSGSYPAASFMAGCVACNPDAIRNAIGVDGAALGIQLSASPVADALAAVGPTSGLPGDYQAAAALVAALLNGGAVNKATAETVAASDGGAKPQYDLNFATNYAKNVMAIVTKNIGAEDPTDPQRAEQNNMVRLMLSVMALNMVYRAAYGGMQSTELQGLLAGDTSELNPEVKGILEQLASLVNAFLPKNSRESTIARLLEYVDSKDSVDSMLETSRMFSSFLEERGKLTGERINSSIG